MIIKAIPIKGKDLKPGDLFSTSGPEYWSRIDDQESIGERCYIRTNTSAMKAADGEIEVYRLEIERQILDLCPHCGLPQMNCDCKPVSHYLRENQKG